ncbi:hypothetical protein Tco_0724683, partial [Tanacetum coccineum]
EDVEGPSDLSNTEGTQEQVVQIEKINHQPTKEASRTPMKLQSLKLINLKIPIKHQQAHIMFLRIDGQKTNCR